MTNRESRPSDGAAPKVTPPGSLTTTIRPASDVTERLSAAAERRVTRLLARMTGASLRLRSIEHERSSPARASSLGALDAAQTAARAEWEDACLALELGLGTPLDRAVQASSIAEFVRDALASREGGAEAANPAPGIVVPLFGERTASPEAPSGRPALTSREAAQRLGCARPDGTPRDSFYKSIAPLLGMQTPGGWRFAVERLEAFERGAA